MDPIEFEVEVRLWRRQRLEIATLLYWTGFALLGTYAATILALFWPVLFYLSAWQLRLSATLREGAFLPLLGATLVVLAGFMKPSVVMFVRSMRRVRALSIWAAFGFVLLIPLQTYAGANQLRSAGEDANRRLQQLSQASKAIESSTTELALRQAILQLPGISAPQLPERFAQEVPQVRARLSDVLRPQIKAAEKKVKSELSKSWQNWLLKAIREALVAGFFAVGFAGIGQSAPQRPTLLMRISSLSQFR